MTNPKTSKMRNIPTTVDGILFASKKEAARWGELKLLKACGNITSLQRQVAIKIDVNGQHVCAYLADFRYRLASTGEMIYEDVKGQKSGAAYRLFCLKKRLVKVTHGIEIVEV